MGVKFLNHRRAFRSVEGKIKEFLELKAKNTRSYGYEFSVRANKQFRTIIIDVTRSYNMGNFIDFELLEELSNWMGTKDINLDNFHYRKGGCDTCDIGSSSSVEIVCSDVPEEFFKRRAGESNSIP